MGWDDLLQEAFTRVLTGARVKPAEVAMGPFIARIIRSMRSAHIRRAGGRETRDAEAASGLELLDWAPGLERALSARQEL